MTSTNQASLPTGEQPAGSAGARAYTFSKEEHLCRKKLIDELFGRGSSFGLYPLRIVWLPLAEPTHEPPQVLVSVSKRTFKRAVDRNYLKRLLREAYRLNKHLLTEAPGGHCVGQLALLYTGKEKKPFTVVQNKLISGLARLLRAADDGKAPNHATPSAV